MVIPNIKTGKITVTVNDATFELDFMEARKLASDITSPQAWRDIMREKRRRDREVGAS